MGAWGPGTFEDDIACDWLEDLYDSDAVAFFEHCLDLSGLDQLGHLACVGVLCTAEMIHGLLLAPRDGLPEAAYRWIEKHVSLASSVQPMVPSAIEGLDRVLDSDSEMYLQWEDAGDELDHWISHVQSLKHQLELIAA